MAAGCASHHMAVQDKTLYGKPVACNVASSILGQWCFSGQGTFRLLAITRRQANNLDPALMALCRPQP